MGLSGVQHHLFFIIKKNQYLLCSKLTANPDQGASRQGKHPQIYPNILTKISINGQNDEVVATDKDFPSVKLPSDIVCLFASCYQLDSC